MTRMFKITDVTERWGCDQKHVLKAIHIGALKAINISESRQPLWRIREADLERYEKSRENDTTVRPIRRTA